MATYPSEPPHVHHETLLLPLLTQPSRIQEHLLHTLHTHSTDWPTLIQNHALALLRSGEVTTFPELLGRVLGDIRADTNKIEANSTSSNRKTGAGGGTEGEVSRSTSLAMPQAVVDEAVKVTRECLEDIVKVKD